MKCWHFISWCHIWKSLVFSQIMSVNKWLPPGHMEPSLVCLYHPYWTSELHGKLEHFFYISSDSSDQGPAYLLFNAHSIKLYCQLCNGMIGKIWYIGLVYYFVKDIFCLWQQYIYLLSFFSTAGEEPNIRQYRDIYIYSKLLMLHENKIVKSNDNKIFFKINWWCILEQSKCSLGMVHEKEKMNTVFWRCDIGWVSVSYDCMHTTQLADFLKIKLLVSHKHLHTQYLP